MRHSLAPSMRADWIRSSGIVSMYCRKRKTPVGVAAPGMISPHRLFVQPTLAMTRKAGIKMTDTGTIKVLMMIRKIASRPRNSYLLSAYAAMLLMSKVTSVANVGEVLPNSDAKMFEILIRINNSDKILRPAMTSGNRIITKTFDNAIFIPTECVYTGADSITFVYKKNKTRQIVILGDMNEKNVIVKQGLEPGASIYVVPPEESADFKLVGENLIASIKEGR